MSPATKTKTKTTTAKRYGGFTDAEKSAMASRVKEMKGGEANTEAEVLAKIAVMDAPDRAMAKKVHAIVRAAAPTLTPKLWYGMPAYYRAGKDGKLVCHFQPAQKFK